MLYFVVHITTATEIARLSYIKHQVQHFFPEARLLVLNQSGQPIKDTVELENIKSCGFGWTLRFLRLIDLQPNDLLIKLDPDVDIMGNPLHGLPLLAADSCFGQVKLVQEVPVFLGGFQGFGSEAAKTIIKAGTAYENEVGRQDTILYRIGATRGMTFIPLPWIDLWAQRDNYDPNSKIISWRRDVPRI